MNGEMILYSWKTAIYIVIALMTIIEVALSVKIFKISKHRKDLSIFPLAVWPIVVFMSIRLASRLNWSGEGVRYLVGVLVYTKGLDWTYRLNFIKNVTTKRTDPPETDTHPDPRPRR